jgi:hypothetical protein
VAALSASGDSEVGFASFAWSIHDTAHDRDLDGNVQARERFLRSGSNVNDIDFGTST